MEPSKVGTRIPPEVGRGHEKTKKTQYEQPGLAPGLLLSKTTKTIDGGRRKKRASASYLNSSRGRPEIFMETSGAPPNASNVISSFMSLGSFMC